MGAVRAWRRRVISPSTEASRLRWWLPGALGAIVLLVAIVSLVRRGDLLAVPAVTLVVLTWLVLALGLVVTWLLRDALPPVARDTAQLLRAAARGLDDDPLGRRVRDRARRTRKRLSRVTLVPAVGRWTAARLRPTAHGLGLTVATAVTVASSAALWALDRQVDRSTSAVAQLDVRFVDLAANVEVPVQRAIMAAITVLGNATTIVTLLAILVVAALAARAIRGMLLLVTVVASATTLTTALKHLEGRVRPAFGQLVETSTSWPSGHATVGLAFALGVCLLIWRGGTRHWAMVAAVVVPTGLLVGYSRAYLTIHWLSDVVAGWLVAILAAAVAVVVDIIAGDRVPPPRPVVRWMLAVGGAVAVLTAAGTAVGGRIDTFPEAPTEPVTRVDSDDAFQPVGQLADRYTRTLLGHRMEPVSLVIAADEDTLRAAVTDAGFDIADRVTFPRLFATYQAGLLGDADPTAPVTPTFFGEYMQDLEIQRPIHGVTARHHARLWRLPVRLADGCAVWVATASRDTGVQWTWRTILPNYRIDPVVDAERDYIAAHLTRTGRLDDAGSRRVVPPTLGTNAAGDAFFTDGNAAVLRQPNGCASGRAGR